MPLLPLIITMPVDAAAIVAAAATPLYAAIHAEILLQFFAIERYCHITPDFHMLR